MWTAAGVTAGIDLALSLVEDDYGTEVAQTVARWLVLYLRRPGGQTQFAAPVWMPRAKRAPIRDVQEAIEAEPGGAHSVSDLARRAAMSPRHFTRVFTDEVGEAPGAYVERVRTEAARRQLEETDDTVTVIAGALRLRHRGNHAAQLRSPAGHLARPVPQDVRLSQGETSCRSPSCSIPGFTALDFIGPYEVLRWLPDAEVRFVWHEPGPDRRGLGACCSSAPRTRSTKPPRPTSILVPGGFDHHGARPRREGARLGAPGPRDGDVDDVGVLGLGDPGRRRPARGQARHVALGRACRC